VALPTNISYGTVVGQFLAALSDGSDIDKNPEGVPMRGTVTFIASPTYVLDYTATPNPVTILKTPIVCPLNENGYVCSPFAAADSPLSPGVMLIATDDPDILPIGWTWTVMYALTDPMGRAISLPNQNISVPAGTTTDLTTAMNIAASNGVIITKGPQGEVGPIGPYGVPVNLTVGEVETGPETPGSIGLQGMKGEPGGIVGGTDLGVLDLNNVLTPGVYRRTSTGTSLLALHYPNDTDSGVLVVLERVAGATVTQTWHTYSPTSGVGGGTFYRVMNGAGAWTAWRFTAAQRIDQTAGRAIYTWDHLNNREQLIYGDTGWRDFATDSTYGIVAAGDFFGRPLGDGAVIAGNLKIRRIGSNVYLAGSGALQPKQDYTTSTRNLCILPSGFRGNAVNEVLICKYGNNGGDASQKLVFLNVGASSANPSYVTAVPLLLANWNGDATGQSYPKSYHGLWVYGSWPTSDPWPTVLPGTASGTIPNL
jgi:hypothetical protein